MSIKNPIWLLAAISVMATISYFSHLPLDYVVWTMVLYVFVLGLWVETHEIRTRESLKSLLTVKIESIEKSISCALQSVETEVRIKERIRQKRREVIEWLSKF